MSKLLNTVRAYQRETGFEPATSTLARWSSTTELLSRTISGQNGQRGVSGCERRDLNPYALRHQILNLACLPISPLSPMVANGPLIVKHHRAIPGLSREGFEPSTRRLRVCCSTS